MMIIRKLLTITFLFLATIVISLGYFSTLYTKKQNSVITYDKGDTYPQLWKRVDSCEKKGLTESALKIIEGIYTKAKEENNAPQFVKSVLYRMKFESYKEEFSLEKSIISLQAEVNSSHYPIKPILQSVLADAFYQYFQNNRWAFYNRSQTVNFKNDDIQTWDLKTIQDAIIKHYKASLENTDSLKRTKVDVYDDVMIKGTGECRAWRPSLYDFLAHRALSYFMNSEADVNRPAQRFTVNEAVYLKAYPEFIKAEIQNPSDSLETKYYALKLMQDLTAFHQHDQNPDALIDVELMRLNYIQRISQHPKKDTLFLNTLQALQSQFGNTPRVTEIDYQIANWYLQKSSQYHPLEGDAYKWYKKTAKEIAENSIKKFPEAYGSKQCKNLIHSITAKSMNINLEEVNEPNKPFRALITSSNISKVYFKIVKTSHHELRKLNRATWGEKLYTKYNNLPVVKTFEQDIPNDNDYQSHSLEVKMPDLPYGYYIVLSSLNPDFKFSHNLTSYATFIVSDIADIERRRDDDGSFDFYALHRQTGEPLKNITAQVWYEKYNYVSREYETRKGETIKSDANGYFNVNYTNDNDRSFYVELINGEDSYYNNNSYYSYKPYHDEQIRLRSFIFTDRSIYRPGQTVFFKSIVLEGKSEGPYKIKAKQPVTVTFYDVNYQKVSSLDLVTNEYGTVAGTFIAPQGGLNGQMHISDGHGGAYISVEEYKRPKFETTFQGLKGSYQLNDEVTVTGIAKAYAGNAIDGAKVNYRVVRKINYPYWYWWYRPYYNTSETEITNGEVTTNDTGAYIIKFKALPDESVSKKSQATYLYEISADVTDINGETHSTQTHVRIGYQSIQLNITADQILDQNHIKPIQIQSTNLNGVAEPSKGSVTIYKLKQPDRVFRNRLWQQPDRYVLTKEEYYKTFPQDLYADENNQYKWAKELKVLEKSFDTGNKTEYDFSSELKNLEAGVYVIEAICKDKSGDDIKAFQYITLFNSKQNDVPEKTAEWFYYPKTDAEPGENISFILASAYPNTHYLFEIEHQDKIKKAQFNPASMNPVSIGIEESYRGNVVFHTTFIKHNRLYTRNNVIYVPYTNKELDIQFETFRNKLLPGQAEEWKLILKDKTGDRALAEMMATMYDASLDAFRSNNWYFDIYQNFYSRLNWGANVARSIASTEFNNTNSSWVQIPYRNYDRLNYFGLGFYNRYNYRGAYADEMYDSVSITESSNNVALEEVQVQTKSKSAEKKPAQKAAAMSGDYDGNFEGELSKKESGGKNDVVTVSGRNGWTSDISESDGKDKNMGDIKARSNFNETAFFFPQLQTNDHGELVIKFTVPESLTKWKVMGLAHTKDLKYGRFEKEVVTQKELMVQPNAPRFFRENDQMTFISKVVNLSENTLNGTSQIFFYNALTNEDITKQICTSIPTVSFTSGKGQTAGVSWDLSIPEGYQAITYKIVAKAGDFTDGEESAVPVLTNRMLVTESMPLPIRGNQTKEFSFEKFTNQNNHSNTLKNHSYTLEFTANPAWYAVQAMPYLMEYPYECVEQTFSRYYANTLASYVVNSKPKIKQIFEAWKMSTPEAFLSNLEKNQELKAVVLEETPWVLQAKNESENKKRVALLFDLNRMSSEMNRALKKVMKAQCSNGGFCWFEGGPDDWYMTQHIVTGFAHLDKLGVIQLRENSELWNMINKAVKYCDHRMREEYEWMKKYDQDYKIKNHLSYTSIQYLYMRSAYKDINIDQINKEHFEYYKKQEQNYWLDHSRYMQGMIALSLHRYDDLKTPKDILKSLKENAIKSEEMGMYWKENYGYFWYEAPVEMQALLIEAFDEINHDTRAVDDMKTWLIKSKQTQHWGTTRATTEAVYALLLHGSDWLAVEPNITITVGDIKLDPKNDPALKAEPGTGYFKKTWTGRDIKPSNMGQIKVEKKDAGVSWGAVYWQYFEQLDKITPHETPLKLKKQLFVQRQTASGPVIEPITNSTKLKLGDKIKVRIELRVDRDMSYVHMKDMRAAGFEPTNVFSGYKWQDGLGYYESTRDAATNFFFSYLNKGTYVFEYPLVVNQYGDFSNGITTIQCMYAPEFTSHSEGIRVKVSK